MSFFIKALQYIWLILALVAIGMGLYSLKTKGAAESGYFLVIVVICGIMFVVNKRRYTTYLTAQKEQKAAKKS
jgi:hypothetical protein